MLSRKCYKLHHHLEFSIILQTDKSLFCSAGISQVKGKLVSCIFLECVWGWPASNQLWKNGSFHFHVTLHTQTDFISHTLEILTDKIHSSIFFPLSTSGSQEGWSLAQLIGDMTFSFKNKKQNWFIDINHHWHQSSATLSQIFLSSHRDQNRNFDDVMTSPQTCGATYSIRWGWTKDTITLKHLQSA